MDTSSLTVSFTHVFVGSSKGVLLWHLFFPFFARRLRLEYLSSDESYDSDEEESDKMCLNLGQLVSTVSFWVDCRVA